MRGRASRLSIENEVDRTVEVVKARPGDLFGLSLGEKKLQNEPNLGSISELRKLPVECLVYVPVA